MNLEEGIYATALILAIVVIIIAGIGLLKPQVVNVDDSTTEGDTINNYNVTDVYPQTEVKPIDVGASTATSPKYDPCHIARNQQYLLTNNDTCFFGFDANGEGHFCGNCEGVFIST